MLHGADYLARLMLCHFACFNNQSNKIRVYRAILLPCYSLNLPRVSPGWCKSVFFFFLYGVISWRLQRSKCAATLQSYHCLTQYSFFFFFFAPYLFLTEHSLQQIPCVSVITAESRGTPWYWLRKGPSDKADIKPEVHSHKPRALFPLLSFCIT